MAAQRFVLLVAVGGHGLCLGAEKLEATLREMLVNRAESPAPSVSML
jgi:hypothetical protein